MSRKKAAESAAAWSGDNGGQSLVFEYPLRGAFAMTPTAQLCSTCFQGLVTRQIPANQLKPSLSQYPPVYVLLTSIAVIHLGFL